MKLPAQNHPNYPLLPDKNLNYPPDYPNYKIAFKITINKLLIAFLIAINFLIAKEGHMPIIKLDTQKLNIRFRCIKNRHLEI